jgi:hypothetical protein
MAPSRGDDAHAQRGRSVHEGPAMALQIGLQSVERVDYTAVGFDHAALPSAT